MCVCMGVGVGVHTSKTPTKTKDYTRKSKDADLVPKKQSGTDGKRKKSRPEKRGTYAETRVYRRGADWGKQTKKEVAEENPYNARAALYASNIPSHPPPLSPWLFLFPYPCFFFSFYVPPYTFGHLLLLQPATGISNVLLSLASFHPHIHSCFKARPTTNKKKRQQQ